jgi:hypothetical protein
MKENCGAQKYFTYLYSIGFHKANPDERDEEKWRREKEER